MFSIFTLLSLRQRQAGAAPEASAGTRASQLRSETERWTREPGGWQWPERWSYLEQLCVTLGLIADGRLASTARLARLLGERAQLTSRLWQAYLRDRSWPELVERASHTATSSPSRPTRPRSADRCCTSWHGSSRDGG